MTGDLAVDFGSGPNSGVYALVLPTDTPLQDLSVGRRGTVDLQSGYYVYVGSALGGLRQRLERHLRRSGKRKHWHIDYLVDRVRPACILAWPTEQELECRLSRRIRALCDGAVEDFGCSDCTCRSHLYYFESSPRTALRDLHLQLPRGGTVRPRCVEPERENGQ